MQRYKRPLLYLIIIVVIFLLAGAYMNGNNAYSIKEVREKISNGNDIFILDVRTKSEYYGELGHISGAHLIPVQELARRVEEIEDHKEREVIVICRTDNRSRAAVRILRQAGFSNVGFVRGGMVEWNEQNGGGNE
jgi:rhodanese-related sulfurtransferase